MRTIEIPFLFFLASTSCQDQGTKPDPNHLELVRVTGIPDENPTELVRKFEPMSDYLGRELGVKVKYVPITDYGAAVQALGANQVEFAWLGGFTFVQAKLLAGAVPLAMRDIDREFKSGFITHAETGITKLEDLKGRTFSFGSKSSTSGHLMPRHFLLQAGINPETDLSGQPLYSGAHDATAKLVESGKVDAGVLNMEVWDRLVAEKKIDTERVKVFWTTPSYVDYVWAGRDGVPPAVREKFRQAFLKLDAQNPEHKVVLDLQGAKKFVPAAMEDFASIETVARSTGLLK